MAQPANNHLKLYAEPTPGAASPLASFPALPAVFDAFQQATGWTIRFVDGSSDTAPSTHGKALAAPPNEHNDIAIELTLDPSAAQSVPRKKAQTLASALAQLLAEGVGLEQALWQREAELATAVPVVSSSGEDQHLAPRLESVLKGGAEAVGCHAAGLYLLDETTSELKLRACWGLPHARLAAPARPLRGSVADLEALLGSAVVLENEPMMTPWRAPEPFAAAVCVPVSTATTILGTLWTFSRRERRFTDRQTNLVEIVAGRLAADLEREILRTQGLDAARWRSQMSAAENLQREQLPSTPPQIDGWQMAGFSRQAQDLGGAFFDWFVRPDNSAVVTIGQAIGSGVSAALVASALKATLRSHGQYPHTPDELLAQANHTLWSGSAGDQQAAALVALLRPNDNCVTLCTAGPLHTYTLGQASDGPPQGPPPLIGDHAESRFSSRQLILQPGRIAICVSSEFSEQTIRDLVYSHAALPLTDLACLLRDNLPPLSPPGDQTIVLLKRTDP